MSTNKPVATDLANKRVSMITGLIKQLKLVWLLFQDKRVSIWAKSVIPIALIYLISPVDFIPGILLPGLGALDDMGVVLLGMALMVKLSPPEIVQYYLHQLEYGNDFYKDGETVDTTYRVVDED